MPGDEALPQWPGDEALPEGPKEGSHVVDQGLWLLHGGEMATAVHVGPVA